MADAYKYHTEISRRQKGAAHRPGLRVPRVLLTAAAGLAQSGAGKSPPRLLPLRLYQATPAHVTEYAVNNFDEVLRRLGPAMLSTLLCASNQLSRKL